MTEIDYTLLTPEARDLKRAQAFGAQVEAFLDTPIGRYLVARAEDERTAALESLAVIDAIDINGIRELQFAVRMRDAFLQWLADAQMDGETAKEQLDDLGRE